MSWSMERESHTTFHRLCYYVRLNKWKRKLFPISSVVVSKVEKKIEELSDKESSDWTLYNAADGQRHRSFQKEKKSSHETWGDRSLTISQIETSFFAQLIITQQEEKNERRLGGRVACISCPSTNINVFHHHFYFGFLSRDSAWTRWKTTIK